MTKPVEPTIPLQMEGPAHKFTREQFVKLVEFFRKSGVPLEAITSILVKHTCVEAILTNGSRRVYSYET